VKNKIGEKKMLDKLKEKPTTRPDYRIIGKPVARHDAWGKVFADTKYANDYTLPGMLYAKVLRSQYAAAKVLSIDTREAVKLAGVEAVMTAKDVPHNETVTRFGQTHKVGGFEGLYRPRALLSLKKRWA
jgi:CO/xanthine dehydrogenase Mo-binding subunit